jgi:hypothetical protein
VEPFAYICRGVRVEIVSYEVTCVLLYGTLHVVIMQDVYSGIYDGIYGLLSGIRNAQMRRSKTAVERTEAHHTCRHIG